MAWTPFSSDSESEIMEAIASAEKTCSGEIRVHIDRFCKGDPYFKATNVFHHLKMDETSLRNGVLIYVAALDHKFAIIGDSGINEKVDDNFWEATKDEMAKKFRDGDLVGGIVTGVNHAGEQLQEYFPADEDKGNELSDDISYGA